MESQRVVSTQHIIKPGSVPLCIVGHLTLSYLMVQVYINLKKDPTYIRLRVASRMIARLKLQNFKTWKDVEVVFAPITTIFGANSSGKSSLTQFLLLMKQTKEATDRSLAVDLNGSYVRLGEFKDIVYSHNTDVAISWEITVVSKDSIALQNASGSRVKPIVRANQYDVEGRLRFTSTGTQANFLSYHIRDYEFSLSPKREKETAFELKASGGPFKFTRTPGRAWQLPGPVKSYAFPDQARTYFQNASFLADLEASFENQLDKVFYLGPLREYPKRDYTWARARPVDVGVRGEKVIDAVLAATAAKEMHNLHRGAKRKSFQEIVGYWLEEMGLIEDFRVEEIALGSNYYQVLVRSRGGGPYVALTDVGFGVSQVLPVIVLLYYVPEGSTIVFEQPEIHLHPSAQAVLADLFISVSERRDLQLIVETHSEHLLLRLQRRIAEKKVVSEEIAVFYSESSGAESQLKELELDELGQLSEWPKNFMGDTLGETLAAEKARLTRLMKV
jgi:predicted ATPase